ncbi:hypothetical protein VE04_07985 [Pseudogymnoascus sp. 24MN13]|nr:hypothetical protein VE04_07985 [Pseudogymnoascus sp. 24MN13]
MAERLPEPEWSGGEPKKGKWVEWVEAALTGIKRTNFPEKGRFGERQDVRTGREQGLGDKSDRGTTTAATIHHHQFITHNTRSHRSAEIEMCASGNGAAEANQYIATELTGSSRSSLFDVNASLLGLLGVLADSGNNDTFVKL